MSVSQAVETARTFLFVPASRPDRFGRAYESGADVVVLDLEDAVAPDAKPAALAAATAWLGAGSGRADCPVVMVRINGLDTRWHAAELTALSGSGVPLMVPKAESADALNALHRRTGGAPLVPLVETPRGVLRAEAVATADGVVRLALGHIDLAASLGVDPDSYDAFRFARSQLVLACAAAGRAAPVDGVTTALNEDERLLRDVEHAMTLGFGGKLCIHPRQIGVVHEALYPRAAEIAWAQRVIAVVDEGAGRREVVAVDGRMVDAPVVARARAILGRARAEAAAGPPDR